jgi:hypothetical protein
MQRVQRVQAKESQDREGYRDAEGERYYSRDREAGLSDER